MLHCLYSVLREFQKSGPESGPEKTAEKIMQLINDNPNITSREIAQKLNMARSGLMKHLQSLQKSGRIRRVGPQKGGYWEVIQ